MERFREMLLRARLDAAALEAWAEAGWLAPRRAEGAGFAFTELDLARACLIRDLREDLGVNDEGVAVILDLLDQVHGMRLAMRRLAASLQRLPEPLRREALAALRAAAGEAAEDDPGGPAGVAR
ncbi:chaperone modulator CbpM [Crenalkalicoccus roseus]|uniref:chaperone modulator CbpM n=1 Tax=Crenalkalicoccus roseus TaxID=1485588 RepID=UPI001081B556|nr:chaperone modulator CbpM [Crenalkalicoccus roseus]